MSAKYRVYYLADDGRQAHLDGECYGDIRNSDANSKLQEQGFHFWHGTALYSSSASNIRQEDGT